MNRGLERRISSALCTVSRATQKKRGRSAERGDSRLSCRNDVPRNKRFARHATFQGESVSAASALGKYCSCRNTGYTDAFFLKMPGSDTRSTSRTKLVSKNQCTLQEHMFVEHVDELFLGNATSKLSEKYPKLLLAFAEISWIVCEISKPPRFLVTKKCDSVIRMMNGLPATELAGRIPASCTPLPIIRG